MKIMILIYFAVQIILMANNVEFKKPGTPFIHKYKNKYFKKHIYLFQYNGIIREKIIQYKFGDKPYYKDFFLEVIIKNNKMCRFLKSYDIIVPIPIHKKRRKQRGYNQTELIAKNIAKKLEILYNSECLIKCKNTNPQSTLNQYNRKKNVIDAYKIKNIDNIKNKRILLFDDVFTTGSTVNECSRILKEAGALKVDILTIAKD